MQGPVDETDCVIQSNMELSRSENGSSRHCNSRKVLMRAESGTCNMCAAPCSSCLHNNRALMGSKADEFSDESSEGNAGSQYSVNDVVPVKSIARRSGQNIASETSNLLSVNSNQESFSENAESKAWLRISEVSCPLEDVGMNQSLSHGVTAGDNQLLVKPQYNSDKRALTNNLENRGVLEGNGESISCVSRVSDAKVLASHGKKSLIREYVPGSSGSAELSSHTIDLIEIPCSGDRSEGVNSLKDSGGLPTDDLNSPEQIEEIEVVKESRGVPGLLETAQLVEDSDGSEIEEHDVKVCDICGDAGREDFLAICTRCSDGAEHTYCMREAMDKVPEGDWLCEECKFDGEIKYLKQDTLVTVHGNDKIQTSETASVLDTILSAKLDKKDSDFDGNKRNKDILSEKASSKRHAETTEVASAVKRQALETTVGSPKVSSPSRIAALSRDLSLRKLDKGKVKSTHQLSSGATSDSSKAAFSSRSPRLQTSHGPLVKSNSFNFTNATPKVKQDDEVVFRKQKSAREFASTDADGTVRLIGKSMSFKSTNPGRSNPSESKVKMLSPKFSHGHDLKGLKQAKDWKILERNNSFKTEHSLVSSGTGNATVSMLRGDKKLASFGESYSSPSGGNHHEPKGVQSDIKSSTLSKYSSHVTRRGSEMPVSLGEIKGQSCVVGASSTNGISSMSSTFTADRPFCNVNEGLSDVLPRPTESTNLGERMRESSTNQSRTSILAGGRSSSCQKSKEIGSYNGENAQSFLGDASASKSLKEVVDKDNKLKAAIEAAMLRKPGICRKNKMPDQSDELSISNTSSDCRIRPQDKLSTSINSRNNFSADEAHEGQALFGNSTAQSCEQTTANNMKHSSALLSEAATSRIGDHTPIELSDRKHYLPSNDTAAVSVLLKMSVIPEHEYIWQGGFEVQKSGKRPELLDGIQAHLSAFASPKVPEVAKRFPSKILLNKVPRLSTWPLQFQEIGVKDDNIALYFFAKDLDSYEKSYKCLLDTMMRCDLALKGNFDGVELLIFPSNHLPEKSQRWNTLYFLWGVFRGKKAHCSRDVPGSPKKNCSPRDLPTATISLPESTSTLGPKDGDLSTYPKDCNVSLASSYPCPAFVESPILSAQTTKEGCDINASSLDREDQCTVANAGQKDYRLDATSLPRIESTNAVPFQEARCTSTTLEDKVEAESKPDVKRNLSVPLAGAISGLKKIDKMQTYLGNATDHQQISFISSKIQGTEKSSKNQVKYERTLKEEEGSLDTQPIQQRHQTTSDPIMKEDKSSQYNHGKRLYEESKWNDVKNAFLDGGFASKKQRSDCNSLSVRGSSSEMNSLRGESFAVEEEIGKESCVETQVSRNSSASAERYFFPFGPRPANDLSSSVNSIPDVNRVSEPNLELALWADMKPSKQDTMLPFSVGNLDLNDDHREEAATNEEEEEHSASLSLSLSAPFPDVFKRTVKPVSKAEQLLPDRQHVNTSLLLFEGMPEK